MTIPYDRQLETRYVASLLGGWATDTTLHPDDLHTQQLAMLARAYETLTQPVGRHYETVDGTLALILPGLRDALDQLDAPNAAALAGHGYALAGDAEVTTRADVTRLRMLAGARRELAQLDQRRQQLLATTP